MSRFVAVFSHEDGSRFSEEVLKVGDDGSCFVAEKGYKNLCRASDFPNFVGYATVLEPEPAPLPAPQVMVNVEPQPARSRTVERDEQGNITRIVDDTDA